MLTDPRVILPVDSDLSGEILVNYLVTEGPDAGLRRQVTITDKELAAQIAATPATIPNPEHVALTRSAIASAEKRHAEEAKAAEVVAEPVAARAR